MNSKETNNFKGRDTHYCMKDCKAESYEG